MIALMLIISGGVLATWVGSPRPPFESPSQVSEREACPVQFNGFQNAFSWYGGPNQVLIEARSGCGGRLGGLPGLEGVKLTLVKNGVKEAVVYADQGQFSLRKRVIQIAAADSARGEGYLR